MHVAFSSFVLFILWRKHITRNSSEVNQRVLFRAGKPKVLENISCSPPKRQQVNAILPVESHSEFHTALYKAPCSSVVQDTIKNVVFNDNHKLEVLVLQIF